MATSRRLYMHTHEHKAIRVSSSANDSSQLFIGALSLPNHQDADLLELPLDLVDDLMSLIRILYVSFAPASFFTSKIAAGNGSSFRRTSSSTTLPDYFAVLPVR